MRASSRAAPTTRAARRCGGSPEGCRRPTGSTRSSGSAQRQVPAVSDSMGGSRKRSRNAAGVRIGTGSTRPVELMAGGRPVGRIFERDGVKVRPQCRMQVSVVLLVILGVRRREYHVAGKAAGAKGGGEPKTTLRNIAILDGLSGFRRGWLYERDPAVRPFNIVGVIAQYGTRLNDLLGEMPASVRKSQRRKIDSAGDAIVGGQRLHAVQDCGEAMCGFLERVTSSIAIRRVCDRHGTAAVCRKVPNRRLGPSGANGSAESPSSVLGSRCIRSGLNAGAMVEQALERLVGVKQHAVGQHSAVVVGQYIKRRS